MVPEIFFYDIKLIIARDKYLYHQRAENKDANQTVAQKTQPKQAKDDHLR